MKEKKRQENLKLGLWNVRTMLDATDGVEERRRERKAERRSALIMSELEHLYVDIAGLNEVSGNGILEEKNYWIYWSGEKKAKIEIVEWDLLSRRNW